MDLVSYCRQEPYDELVALVHRRHDFIAATAPIVRVHSACLTGEALHSLRCDCGPQLEVALKTIAASDWGILVYLSTHEGRGIGLLNKVRAYALQDQGSDTVQANRELGFVDDARSYAGAAAALRDLGASRIRLLTNNPDKVAGLSRCGISVVERLQIWTSGNTHNRVYLQTKCERMGHYAHECDTPVSDDQPLAAER